MNLDAWQKNALNSFLTYVIYKLEELENETQ